MHPYPYPTATRPPFHHGRHILASVITGGLWLPVYAWRFLRARNV